MLERQLVTNGTQCMIAELHHLVEEAKKYYSHETKDKADVIDLAWSTVRNFLTGALQGIEKARSADKLPEITLAHIPENVFQALVFILHHVPNARKLILADPRMEQAFDAEGFNIFFLALQNSLRIHKRPGGIDPREIELHINRIMRLNGADISPLEVEGSEPFPIQTDQITFLDIIHGTTELHDVLMSLRYGLVNEFEREQYDIVDRFLIGVLSTERAPSKNIAATYTLEDVPDAVCDAIAFLQAKDEKFHLAVLGYNLLIDGEVSYDRLGRRQAHAQNPLSTNPINIAALNSQRRLKEGVGTLDEQIRFDLLTEARDHRISIGVIAAHGRARIEGLFTEVSMLPAAQGIFARGMAFVAKWWGGVREQQRRKSIEKMIKKWCLKLSEPLPFNEHMEIISRIFQDGEKRPEVLTGELLDAIRSCLQFCTSGIDPAYSGVMEKEKAQAQSGLQQVEMLKRAVAHLVSARKDLFAFPEYLRSVHNLPLIEGSIEYRPIFEKKLSSKIAWVQYLPNRKLIVCADGLYVIVDPGSLIGSLIGREAKMNIDLSSVKQMRCTEDSDELPSFLSEDSEGQNIFGLTGTHGSKRVLWSLYRKETVIRQGWSGAYHGNPELDEHIDVSIESAEVGVGQNVQKFYILSENAIASITEDQDGMAGLWIDRGEHYVMDFKLYCATSPEDIQILPGNFLVLRKGGNMRIYKIDIRKKDDFQAQIAVLNFVRSVAVDEEKPFTLDNGVTVPPKKYDLPPELCGPVCFVPEKYIVSSTVEGELVIYDIEAKKVVYGFKVHDGPVTHIQVLPNGNIVSAGEDCRVVISKPEFSLNLDYSRALGKMFPFMAQNPTKNPTGSI